MAHRTLADVFEKERDDTLCQMAGDFGCPPTKNVKLAKTFFVELEADTGELKLVSEINYWLRECGSHDPTFTSSFKRV